VRLSSRLTHLSPNGSEPEQTPASPLFRTPRSSLDLAPNDRSDKHRFVQNPTPDISIPVTPMRRWRGCPRRRLAHRSLLSETRLHPLVRMILAVLRSGGRSCQADTFLVSHRGGVLPDGRFTFSLIHSILCSTWFACDCGSLANRWHRANCTNSLISSDITNKVRTFGRMVIFSSDPRSSLCRTGSEGLSTAAVPVAVHLRDSGNHRPIGAHQVHARRPLGPAWSRRSDERGCSGRCGTTAVRQMLYGRSS
jgi:hypothetical protein